MLRSNCRRKSRLIVQQLDLLGAAVATWMSSRVERALLLDGDEDAEMKDGGEEKEVDNKPVETEEDAPIDGRPKAIRASDPPACSCVSRSLFAQHASPKATDSPMWMCCDVASRSSGVERGMGTLQFAGRAEEG